MARRDAFLVTTLSLAIVVAGCSSSTEPPPGGNGGEFTLRGSSSAPPAGVAAPPAASLTILGTPSAFTIKLYDLYLSAATDCSSPILVSGSSTPISRDMVASPTLFVGTIANGTYPCMIIKLVDVIDFATATTVGPCTSGSVLRKDFYKAPDTDFRNLSLGVITATGSSTTPGPDDVFVLFSTNPAAVTARGFSPNQTQSLPSAFVVPTSATLYWDRTNTLVEEDGECSLEPAALAVR